MKVEDVEDLTAAIPTRLAFVWGWAGAAVLVQMHHKAGYQGTEGGWYEASSADLARITGLSSDTARREMRKLIEAGAVEREEQIGNHGQGKNRYRPTFNPRTHLGPKVADSAPGDSATPGPGDSATPGPGDSATPSYVQDGRAEDSNTPPTPPDEQGGGDGADVLELFASGQDAPTRAARAKGSTSDQVRALQFGEWWDGFPSKAEPDGRAGARGGRAEAERAWGRALKPGGRVAVEASTAELFAARDHYLAARVVAAEIFGAWPPLMHASTFLNSKRVDWAAPIEGPDDERLGRWERPCRGKAREAADATGSSWEVPESGAFAGKTEEDLNELARALNEMEAG